jgi:hypothetical protein
VFDYFGVLISVILGLALTHLLRGLARLIQMRREIRPYWVHILWTINVVVFVLAIWWGMFWWRGLQSWTFEWFFFIALYAIALFMWASMLYPPEFSHGLDFEQYFFANRYWFFGIQSVVVLFDVVETLQKGAQQLRSVPGEYALLISAFLIITMVGMITSKRFVHGLLAVAWAATILSYLFLSAVARIVEH